MDAHQSAAVDVTDEAFDDFVAARTSEYLFDTDLRGETLTQTFCRDFAAFTEDVFRKSNPFKLGFLKTVLVERGVKFPDAHYELSQTALLASLVADGKHRYNLSIPPSKEDERESNGGECLQTYRQNPSSSSDATANREHVHTIIPSGPRETETENDSDNQPKIRLRIYHDFERPRNGRQVVIRAAGQSTRMNDVNDNERDFNSNGDDAKELVTIYARLSDVRGALSKEIDTRTHDAHVYDGEAECFVSLKEWASDKVYAEVDACVHGNERVVAREVGEGDGDMNVKTVMMGRIDVKLVSHGRGHGHGLDNEHNHVGLADRMLCNSSETGLTSRWFGIGILRGKAAANHGTLWRSALQFGASMVFTIGQRYARKVEGRADVYKTLRQIPFVPYADVGTFLGSIPMDAKLVAVEYGGCDLRTFEHPRRAIYVLGSEDAGLSPALVNRAHAHVSIPTTDGRPDSLNVASAGAIIMYDRFLKLSSSTT